MMKRHVLLTLFLLFSVLSSHSLASLWKKLAQAEQITVKLYALDVGILYDEPVGFLLGKATTDNFSALVLYQIDASGNYLNGGLFQPAVSENPLDVGTNPTLLLTDNKLIVAGVLNENLQTPFFVGINSFNNADALYLTDNSYENYRINFKTSSAGIFRKVVFLPGSDYFYFVNEASSTVDCGVSGVYIARVKEDLSGVDWHKFLGLAYEKKVCTSYNDDGSCEESTIYFPISCGTSTHSLTFKDALVDAYGNLILLGKIYIAYYSNNYAGFVWSISPQGETNWFKIFAIPEDSNGTISFEKGAIIGNNLIIFANTRRNSNFYLNIISYNLGNGTILTKKISSSSFTTAPQILGVTTHEGKIFVSVLGQGKNYFLIFNSQTLSLENAFETGLALRDFKFFSSGLVGLIGNTLSNMFANQSLSGDTCGKSSSTSDFAFSDDSSSFNIMDYDDLPHPQGNTQTTYSVKLYEVSPNGNYESAQVSYVDGNLSIETICHERRLSVFLPSETGCSIEDDREEISCPDDCEGWYLNNQQVKLGINCPDDTGFLFAGWEGDCAACGTNSTCTITMDSDKTCMATFVAANNPPVAPHDPSPADGATGVSYEEVDLSWEAEDPDEDTLSYKLYFGTVQEDGCVLEMLEDNLSEPSYILEGLSPETTYCWQVKACDAESCTQGPVWSFTTKASLTIYTLSVAVNPEVGGTIAAEGIACPEDCSEEFEEGSLITLTAEPNDGFLFAGWEGDCAACGTNSTCTITMDSDKTCTATFEEEVLEAGPDLVVTKLITPRYWRYGRPTRVTVMIENQGEADVTEPFRVRLFANPVAYTVELGEMTVEGLSAGERKILRFRFEVEEDLCYEGSADRRGVYHVLHVVVDADDEVSEINEENNEKMKDIWVRSCPMTN